MNGDKQIAHVFGMGCKKCGKIFSICRKRCLCGTKLQMVTCAFQIPKGCLFVYDNGKVPGGYSWAWITDREYEEWQKAVRVRRPGAS
jgi:hypothetical protein